MVVYVVDRFDVDTLGLIHAKRYRLDAAKLLAKRAIWDHASHHGALDSQAALDVYCKIDEFQRGDPPLTIEFRGAMLFLSERVSNA